MENTNTKIPLFEDLHPSQRISMEASSTVGAQEPQVPTLTICKTCGALLSGVAIEHEDLDCHVNQLPRTLPLPQS